MRVRLPIWAVGSMLAAFALPVAVPQQAGVSLLSRCHYRAQPDSVRSLPAALTEISGLALHRGLLLAHDDEMGRIYAINPATGAMGVFATLRGPVRDDFEGIAVLGDTLWLMTSRGWLYGLKATASTTPAAFVRRSTGLGKQCELEGLAADEAAGVLLLPCKLQPKDASGVMVYRWDVARGALATPAAVHISSASLKGAGAPRLRPSAIEVLPGSRHLLVLSSSPPALIEFDGAGAAHGYARVASRHAQPEGLAIAASGDLFISDEGGNGKGTLSIYRCRP
jgi:hypothetical protein